MKIFCEDISTSDTEFGSEICFSDKINNRAQLKNIVPESIGNYVLLQRTYSEDEFDDDYTYIEFSDFEKSGKFKNYKMDLYRTRLLISYENEDIEILFSVDNSKYNRIKNTIRNIVSRDGYFIIHD